MMSDGDEVKYKYLYNINSPKDLRKYSENELPLICDEVRDYLIDAITQIGGHFGSGLGVVELTVALHYVYNTPVDKLIFDVGHQGYPHKILTGRRDALHTIRKFGGLSGFLKPNESEYDAFGAGHASTSISAALGMATARDFKGEDYRVAAIIGDGAMTGGLAYEGLNNCGVRKSDITVILNDNNMSINQNVSALSNYFNDLYASSMVQKFRENIWQFTNKFDFGDRLRRAASRLEDGVKAIVTPGVLFEAMGFNYFGPINGHNVQKLIRVLRLIKDLKGPVLLHVVTHKGKGYLPAERDSHYFHAIGTIDKKTGLSTKTIQKNTAPEYYKIFGNTLTELARKNKNLLAITAAMADGTGLDIFAKNFPERVIDVGIAEEHAVTFAAGLAMQGMTPIVAIYSSFLQRAVDQIAHDVALQKLPVVFAIDRAGIVGEDGQTHHGLLDIAFLRAICDMTVTAPKDEQELRDLLYSATEFYKVPFSIRYPRGKSLGVPIKEPKKIPYASWEITKHGTDLAILAVGKMVRIAEEAAIILTEHDISAQVVNCRFIKPMDTVMLDSISANFDHIFTIEDAIVLGGFGSGVAEYFVENDYKNNLKILGVPDRTIEHGSQEQLFEMLALHPEGVANTIRDFFSR
ncbi:MAG: 1-deoxy-D-xylulose-5-phosphate synthase [Candidatus Kapabacteria bacterium]|nr:1-deoxy-D-xylulose-5-phosphate synthase [Candidatus Kapabacteria bacterium]